MLKNVHYTLDGEAINLDDIAEGDRAFLEELFKAYEAGEAYSTFANKVYALGSPVLRGGRWITKEVRATALYRVCEDLADRLGIAQGLIGPDGPEGDTARP